MVERAGGGGGGRNFLWLLRSSIKASMFCLVVLGIPLVLFFFLYSLLKQGYDTHAKWGFMFVSRAQT